MPVALARRLRGRGPAGQPVKDQALEGRQFRSRAMSAFLLIVAALLLLGLRYLYLQVINYEEYATRSASNQVRIVPVAPNRGLIYDRRGRPVAENRPAYRLELVPEKVGDLEQVIGSLGQIIELPANATQRSRRGAGASATSTACH
jgi:penicillin-binding protein 2